MKPLIDSHRGKWLGLIFGTVVLMICFLLSLSLGLQNYSWNTLVRALVSLSSNIASTNQTDLIIQTARLPRAVIAVVVGANMAMAGVLMQGLTRNPLASPGIFGINAGAAFFVVMSISFFSVNSLTAYTWIAFAGAAISGIIVYVLGSTGREGMTPIKLTIAGAAISALFYTLVQGILALDQRALEETLSWISGSVQGRKLEMLAEVMPFFLLAWCLTAVLARPMTTLLMGDDTATGLGMRTTWVKLSASVIIILLAGGSVAVAGPISLVGLIIPHMARSLVGIDYRWLLPYCAILGGAFLLLADVGARFISYPEDIPVGVLTALIGAPFFILIARRGFTAS
ncbi:iron ABC transporter permease [Mechercharimyces sp. CAU 1602]|uniref:FecCD family ABC transporter permease n=1 Tax=Mechercharimyces sp. CAU 1602 TaxID=2973933 RepID=UPI002161E557|nr:iron ABC transporter permease [Mechercharimyces sp. CAU 1602]MCS1352837.1 iron ABC transporter permease [Mechercharimyces sp. CAU 1602]